jgi:membrane protein YdbS with pleckstrin-like domain
MPNDVKAMVSALSLIVAAVLAYWSGSPIRPEFSTYIMVTTVFMVVAMWISPRLAQRSATRAIDLNLNRRSS